MKNRFWIERVRRSALSGVVACGLFGLAGHALAQAAGDRPADAEVPAPSLRLSPELERPDTAAAQIADQRAARGDGEDSSASLDTLSAVVARVWRENPEVLQAEEALKASGYDIMTARAGYFPYVQVQSAFAEQSSESVSTLHVVLPIWQGGLTNARVDTAKARQRQAMAELARVRLDLGQRTLEAFLNVAAAQDQQIQWRNYVGALRRLEDTIRRRAETGLAPQADVDTVVSRMRQAQANIQSSRAQLMSNRATLAGLLGTTPGAVQWPDDAYLLSDEEIAGYRRHIDKNPVHLVARAEVDVQTGTAATSRASLWPELSLQYRKQLEGTRFDPSNDATVLALGFDTNNGVAGYLSYRAEKQRIDAYKARLDALTRQIEATLDADRAQLDATTAQLGIQYEAVQATNALVESFMRQFEAGRKSWLEVLNAQREANEIVLQSITVRRNYWYANSKLALDSMRWHRLNADVVIGTDRAAGE